MPSRSDFYKNADTARTWARWMLAQDNLAVLDTETTGIDQDAEVISVAVVDSQGAVVLHEKTRPCAPVPCEATAIHGITNAALSTAPVFAELYPALRRVASEYHVVMYNAAFDARVIGHSCRLARLPSLGWPAFNCAMEAFAAYWGDWSEYHQSYKWKSLSVAAGHAGYEHANAHDALNDAWATLAVLKHLAKSGDADHDA